MARSASTIGHETESHSHIFSADPSTHQYPSDHKYEQQSSQSSTLSDTQLGSIVSGPGNAAHPLIISPPPTQLPLQRPALSRAVSGSLPLTAGDPSHVGYLANRRSAPSLHRSFSETAVLPSLPLTDENRPTKKSRAIRLSMDSEGNAMVTTKDTSSPSPPRPSQSAMLPDASSPSVTPIAAPYGTAKRSYNGRSQDSRSWEFWCDREARSELGNVAEKDSHGSAAGAIGLLRTASGRSVLGPLSSKRNAPADGREHSVKRSKFQHKRTSLQRSQTSAGRLQGRLGQAQVPSKLKHMNSASGKHNGNGDSDKENWSPTHDLDADYESQSGDQGGYTPMPGHSSQRWSVNGKTGLHRGDVGDPEADPELSAFMSSGRKGVRPTANADLDCVEGLLRLSQGNWQQGPEVQLGNIERRR